MIDTAVKIISINCNTNNKPTENALQIAVECKADIILIQEPWFGGERVRNEWTSLSSTSHLGYTQILLNYDTNHRLRTLTYVSKTFSPSVNLVTDSPNDTDI